MLLKEPMRSTSQSVDRPGRRCTTEATQLVRGQPGHAAKGIVGRAGLLRGTRSTSYSLAHALVSNAAATFVAWASVSKRCAWLIRGVHSD